MLKIKNQKKKIQIKNNKKNKKNKKKKKLSLLIQNKLNYMINKRIK